MKKLSVLAGVRKVFVYAGVAGVASILGLSLVRAEGGIRLLSAVDDEPIDVTTLVANPGSPAVEEFLRTGRNVYVGDEQAAKAGKERYEQWCRICHLADASGRMGPSLVDEVYNYKRSHLDQGLFEVIYAGAAGAMQPFNERLTPDEILKVIAYVRSLRP